MKSFLSSSIEQRMALFSFNKEFSGWISFGGLLYWMVKDGNRYVMFISMSIFSIQRVFSSSLQFFNRVIYMFFSLFCFFFNLFAANWSSRWSRTRTFFTRTEAKKKNWLNQSCVLFDLSVVVFMNKFYKFTSAQNRSMSIDLIWTCYIVVKH